MIFRKRWIDTGTTIPYNPKYHMKFDDGESTPTAMYRKESLGCKDSHGRLPESYS